MTGSIKTSPSQTKCFKWMFTHITHSIIYHYQKEKRDFCDAKVIEGPEGLDYPLRVFFRFHSDRVVFRFLRDRLLLWLLSDRILCESSVIGSCSGSSITDSSFGSWVLFFRHATIFIKTCYYFFFVKNGHY